MHIQINEAIRSILIVEDEMIVAMLMEDLIRELGVEDVHICTDVASALELLVSTPIDLAVLDLKVRDGDTTPVADHLSERMIPFVFSSGSDSGALAERHSNRPMITKPFLDDDLKLVILDTWTLAQSSRNPGRHPELRVATSGATD